MQKFVYFSLSSKLIKWRQLGRGGRHKIFLFTNLNYTLKSLTHYLAINLNITQINKQFVKKRFSLAQTIFFCNLSTWLFAKMWVKMMAYVLMCTRKWIVEQVEETLYNFSSVNSFFSVLILFLFLSKTQTRS